MNGVIDLKLLMTIVEEANWLIDIHSVLATSVVAAMHTMKIS